MRNIRKMLKTTCSKNNASVVGKAHSSQGMRSACRPNRQTPSIEAHFRNSQVESNSLEALHDSYARQALRAT
jgi:hypothetical protein